MASRNRKHPKPGPSVPREPPAAPAGPPPRPAGRGILGWLELAVALLLTVAVVTLHVLLLFHGGGLWRDEVNTINLATAPSLGQLWSQMEYDSFPLLWFMAVRVWTAVGIGQTDFGLRVLGLLMGLAVLGAVWWNARNFGRRVPLLALVLLGFCPTVLRYGDSLRAYGSGVLLMLLALGAIWRMIEQPRAWRIALAAAAALLSVQCLYYNSVMLLAIGLGAVAVCVRRRAWKTATIVMAIGAASALSLAPYVAGMSRLNSWNVLIKSNPSVSAILEKFRQAVDSPDGYVIWVWAAAVVVLLAVCGAILARRRTPEAAPRQDAALFLLVTGSSAIICYVGFLKVLAYPTQPWYYITLVVLLAVLTDGAVNLLAAGSTPGRLLQVAAAVGLAYFVNSSDWQLQASDSWQAACTRFTNIDLVAAKVNQEAAASDLIVINPWWPGITFERYYHGPASWATVPDIGHPRLHRYDLMKEKMSGADPMSGLLEQVDQTLRSGHRVWVVGELQAVPPGKAVQPLPPAPTKEYGWSEGPYNFTWSLMLGTELQRHALKFQPMTPPSDSPVMGFENFPLSELEGWH